MLEELRFLKDFAFHVTFMLNYPCLDIYFFTYMNTSYTLSPFSYIYTYPRYLHDYHTFTYALWYLLHSLTFIYILHMYDILLLICRSNYLHQFCTFTYISHFYINLVHLHPSHKFISMLYIYVHLTYLYNSFTITYILHIHIILLQLHASYIFRSLSCTTIVRNIPYVFRLFSYIYTHLTYLDHSHTFTLI